MATPTETLFLRAPEAWVATPGCVCRSSAIGFVSDVNKEPMLYAAGAGGALPGLTPDETAILAGVLTGLAAFLFLLLPILCCLCPLPCACCGFGKKKSGALVGGGHKHGNMTRANESEYWAGGAGGGDKMDYENLYGVDMKLPRAYLDNGGSHLDQRMHGMEDGGWEGIDVTRDEIDASLRNGGGGEETIAQQGLVSYTQQSGEHAGSGMGGAGSGAYSTVDRSRNAAGDEVITEYTTTRRLDMTMVGGMNQDEAEGYYASNYGGSGGQSSDMSKDNFMKIYDSYRKDMNGHN